MNIWRWLILACGWASLSAALAAPLPAEQAFNLTASAEGPATAHFAFDIADGYYLYRKKFKFVAKTGGVELGNPIFPLGEKKIDPNFGEMEIYRNRVAVTVPVKRGSATAIPMEITYQGCSDEGVCYPPMRKTLDLRWPTATATPPLPVSEQDQATAILQSGSWGWTLLSFLGFGVLLAFTPCMFPMIPILSGIIAGQGSSATPGKSFLLSLVYVLAAALTYTLLGLLAGLFGQNLQAAMQTPWVLGGFSLVFVALALSMFGFYELQMPAALQSRLYALSGRQQGGRWLGAAVMGLLSALIMGPCVAAPLAGALVYLGQTGDAWLGGAALFALGIGMGLPLLAIGASAGSLLPKAGPWMGSVKTIFGVILLGLAINLLERVLPVAVSLFLWAALLIVSSVYLGALDALPTPSSGWRRLCKGFGLILLVYGSLLLVGVSAGGKDPLQPLWGVALAGNTGGPTGLAFRTVHSVSELEREVATARAEGHWAMLDFYADWCASCKEMEKNTFADPAVKQALANTVLIKADVTANDDGHQTLLKRFGLVGPPATLFFQPGGEEQQAFRLVGYVPAGRFVEHLGRLFGKSV